MDAEKFSQYMRQKISELKELEGLSHDTGSEKLYQIRQEISRVIHRVYPAQQADKVERDLLSQYIIGTDDDRMQQGQYIDSVRQAIQALNVIQSELELFGTDFTPVKENVETEWGVGLSGQKNFLRRRISK